jgi:hypothetical protein
MAQLREEVMRAGETPAEQAPRENREGKGKEESWQEVMEEFEKRKARSRRGVGMGGRSLRGLMIARGRRRVLGIGMGRIGSERCVGREFIDAVLKRSLVLLLKNNDYCDSALKLSCDLYFEN